jgi:hypothetical protein
VLGAAPLAFKRFKTSEPRKKLSFYTGQVEFCKYIKEFVLDGGIENKKGHLFW